ncbi:hypothetical protein CPB85DRAFT_1568284 [Mucidula mucida]|nr:hypothetical protein CPB85DRAFT_1568284 [Mucidula mucida]
MATTLESELTYQSHDGGKTWTRELFGFEQQIASMAANSTSDGFGAYTAGMSIVLPRILSKETMQEYVTSVWISLRRVVPTAALKSRGVDRDPSKFIYEYTVPSDGDEALQWANDTILWIDEKMTLHDREVDLYNNYWSPTTGHYVTDLVICPSSESKTKWNVLFHSLHSALDGRGSLQMFDIFVRFLNDLVCKGATPPSVSENWGEETKRLLPCVSLLVIRQLGLPLETLLPKPPIALEPAAQATPDGAPPLPFLRPFSVVDESPENIQNCKDVCLTVEQTLKLRKACRAHGYTVTQFLVALKAVTEVEWVMRFPQDDPEDQRLEAIRIYRESSIFPTAWNLVDQRYKLKDYTSHSSEHSSPSFAADGCALVLSMDAMRAVVKFDEATRKVETKPEHFWDTAVAESKKQWTSCDLSLNAYVTREVERREASKEFNGASYMVPALLSTSLGELEALDIATRFSESIPSEDPERILIEEFGIAIRTPTTLKTLLFWQWNNRLTIRVTTGAKWTTNDGIVAYNNIFERWINDVY